MKTPLYSTTKSAAYKKILWITFCRGIGDTVLLYPALDACTSIFPSAAIDIVVRNPIVEEVLRIYGFSGRIFRIPRRLSSYIPLLMRIGPASYSAVFDASSMEQVHLSRCIARWAARHRCIGYHYGSSSWLYTDRLDTRPLAFLHMKDINGGLLSPFTAQSNLPLKPPSPAPHILDALPLPHEGPRIVVHPGGRDNISTFEKRWPADNYCRLIQRIKAAVPAHVIVIGSAQERGWLDEHLGGVLDASVVNTAGQASIAQVFEIIRGAALFVGNNSGPLHIAAACAVPLITFAGGVPISRWGAPKNSISVTLGIDKRCPVCTEYECDRHGKPCIEAVTVDETFNAAIRLLNR